MDSGSDRSFAVFPCLTVSAGVSVEDFAGCGVGGGRVVEFGGGPATEVGAFGEASS